MIGGRIFDVSAITGFATARSVYAEALVMTAIEENIVLLVPGAGLARAAAHVVHCAQRRGWPVMTNNPEPLLTLDNSVEIESLP